MADRFRCWRYEWGKCWYGENAFATHAGCSAAEHLLNTLLPSGGKALRRAYRRGASFLHPRDHRIAERRAGNLGGAIHQTGKVIGDHFIGDGRFHRFDDEIGCLAPT